MSGPQSSVDIMARVAVMQGPAAAGSVEQNLTAIETAARESAAAGARLLVTPEMSATGYNIGHLTGERAESLDGPIVRSIIQLSQRYSLTMVVGLPERESRRLYDTAVVVAPSGRVIARHRKVHLFGELDRDRFAPGDRLVTQFEYAGHTFGLAVCYDVEFPELVRAHADSGTDVLMVPTGLMQPYTVVSRILVPARAYENQLFIVYANRCGAENGLEYCGDSVIVGPDGADLARAGTAEELLLADLDAAALADGRRRNTHLADRRPDLYPAKPFGRQD